MKLNLNSDQFELLINSWGNLIPWDGTNDVLTKLYQANFSLATLSNGDVGTLTNAVKIFDQVKMTYIFSSDFPIGAFKSASVMYNQLLTTPKFTEEQVLHIAGAPIDGKGARDYGLFAGLVYNQPIPSNKPCFLLNNITDLLTIMGL